jgi:hypothetical protein
VFGGDCDWGSRVVGLNWPWWGEIGQSGCLQGVVEG